MSIDTTFAKEFIERLNAVSDLGSTSNVKFQDLRDWLTKTLGRSATPSYLSSLSRQYKARVGAALTDYAEVMVLLSNESWSTAQRGGDAYVERLEEIVRYTAELEAVIACVGDEGDWKVEFVVGPDRSEMRRDLAAAFDAEDRPVSPRGRGGRAGTEPPPPSPTKEWSLEGLAEELYLPRETLKSIEWLLRDKKALVLYGPPGTGKTYLAQRIAQQIQPEPRLRRLVQLHPSFGYEEFFEGYRPVGEEHGIALAKRDGPLRTLSRNAVGAPGHPAVLVLDEMNRANLPRVFGELFFLLEYRDASVGLMYSPTERFSLPADFYLIGTMNTADRSVATLDQALRRRFHFFGMFPSEEPIPTMFSGFLNDRHPKMLWLADLLERANALLADRNVAIGPSHFMRADLDETIARRVWEHSVLPTIRDQFFDDEARAEEFDFDLLRESDGAA